MTGGVQGPEIVDYFPGGELVCVIDWAVHTALYNLLQSWVEPNQFVMHSDSCQV